MPGQYRDMWVGLYNPDPRDLTVTVTFRGGPGVSWSTQKALVGYQRDVVAAQNVVPVADGAFENFATEVTFPPGRVGVASFALWHLPNYGQDRVVDLSPTFLCRTPVSN